MRIVWRVAQLERARYELSSLRLDDPALHLEPGESEGLVEVSCNGPVPGGLSAISFWDENFNLPPGLEHLTERTPQIFTDVLWCCQVRQWPLNETFHLRVVRPDTDNEEFVHPYFRQRQPGWCGITVRACSDADLQSLEIEWVDSGALATGIRYLEDRALLFYRGVLVEVGQASSRQR